MTAATYEIRECQKCGLRYPLPAEHPFGPDCPVCGAETRLILRRALVTKSMNSTSPPAPLPLRAHVLKGEGSQLEGLLDNVRSAWNVGSIFRTADGLGIDKLHLCGITPTPMRDRVRKTGLGAEKAVAWTYSRNALQAAKELKARGLQLWALEQDARGLPLEQALRLTDHFADKGIVLIVGNEISGIDAELLDLCNPIIHIPMHGSKRSFNVATAFGIAAYALQTADGARRQEHRVFNFHSAPLYDLQPARRACSGNDSSRLLP